MICSRTRIITTLTTMLVFMSLPLFANETEAHDTHSLTNSAEAIDQWVEDNHLIIDSLGPTDPMIEYLENENAELLIKKIKLNERHENEKSQSSEDSK